MLFIAVLFFILINLAFTCETWHSDGPLNDGGVFLYPFRCCGTLELVEVAAVKKAKIIKFLLSYNLHPGSWVQDKSNLRITEEDYQLSLRFPCAADVISM